VIGEMLFGAGHYFTVKEIEERFYDEVDQKQTGSWNLSGWKRAGSHCEENDMACGVYEDDIVWVVALGSAET
jgi:hypothetical protein